MINTALCCECGNLRTIAETSEIRWDDDQLSGDDGDDWRGWRMTAALECSVCGRWTTHAFLLPDGDDSPVGADLPQPEPVVQDDDRLINDIHRRIRNVLDACPATTWTTEESRAVLDVLAGIVRKRQ